jgi:hypothetical protein
MLPMKMNFPLAASTSGAISGIDCMAPSTLACITASNSAAVGDVHGQIQLHIVELPAERSERLGLGHIDFQCRGTVRLQRCNRVIVARSRKYLPAVGQQLAREFTAYAA